VPGEDLDSAEGEVFGRSGSFLEPEGGVVESSAALLCGGVEAPPPLPAEGGRRGTVG